MMKPSPNKFIGLTVENRYEILSLVGEGGVAQVFKAKNRQTGQFVAIKILKRHELYSNSDIERLKREAKALQKLVHPNILKAHSFGFLVSGQPYIVLDFLSGKSLEEYINSGVKLPIPWIVQVLIQTCRGLACAHDNGLIHRDLKPSNIMVIGSPDDGDFVKLLDFGTAKSTVPSQEEMVLTKPGIIFGCPFYLSPEQIQGQGFDKRADIYSFGCLTFETLTGRLPFEGKNQFETLMKHVNEEAPAFADVTERKIPVALQAIVLKCIEKDPAQRFQQAADVEKALQFCLDQMRTSN